MANIDDFINDAGGEVINFTPPPSLPGKKIGSLRLLSVGDAMRQPMAGPYYVKELIEPNSFSVWYGAPGSGKSFLMLHIAYAIAQGREVFGRRVRQTPVVYLALEATNGLAKRIKGLVQKHGQCDAFNYVPMSIDFNDPAKIDDIITVVRETGAGVLMVDTLARAIPGVNENASEGMGGFIAACDRIKDATSCHVAVVHHSGKNADAGARGHSNLNGAVDVSVEVTGLEGTRTAAILKNKEGATGDSYGFDLPRIILGIDDDGDDITTCTVEETNAPIVKMGNKKLHDREATLLQDLINLVAEPGSPAKSTIPEAGMAQQICVNRDDLRKYLARKGWFSVPEGEALTAQDRKDLHKFLNGLRAKNKIGISGDLIWVLR